MTRTVFFATAALALASSVVLAQTPLTDKRFEYGNLPYQVDTDNGERGTQQGYNRCNSTTEGQDSLCQTAMINSVDDWCLWGPPDPNSVVGDTEGEAVAWCTKPGRGTRLIPQGAIKGVQFMRTPDYVQVAGVIRQADINMTPDDSGGEMDPHGADNRGNPLGGLVFSNAFGSGGDNFQQVIEWHNFMGSELFCLKACDPAGPNAADFCEHIYDRIGCYYNAPADYDFINGTYTSCDGENQDYPGVYTDSAGNVQTYRQPPEANGEIQTLPYDPKIPASSNCQTFTSAAIFSQLPTGTVADSGPTSTTGMMTSATNTGTSSPQADDTGSGTDSAGPEQTSNAARPGLVVPVPAGMAGSAGKDSLLFFALTSTCIMVFLGGFITQL